MISKVRTVDRGSFVTPIYDISIRKDRKGKHHFVNIPCTRQPVGYHVYGYKYKTGTGWKLIGETVFRSDAMNLAREYDAEMCEYWDLTTD